MSSMIQRRPATCLLLATIGCAICLSATRATARQATASSALSISGRAVDENGKSLGGIVARLFAPVDPYRRSRIELGLEEAPKPVAEATSDASGRFEVAAPGAGLWLLELADKDLSSGGRVAQRPLLVSENLALGAAKLERVRRVDVRVRSAGGEPLQGARVGVARFDRGNLPAFPPPVTTDARGLTSLLLPANDIRRATEVVVTQSEHAVARQQVRGDRVELTLRPGTIRRLRVLDADGRPAVATAILVGGTTLGLTDAEGRMELRVEPKGLEILLHSPTSGTASVGLRGVASATAAESAQSTPKQPEKAASATTEPERVVTLRAPTLVEGTVVEKDTKEPVPGALATSFGSDKVATSDAAGRFELRLPAAQDRGEALEVRKPGYATGGWWARDPNLERATALIELERELSIEGIVVDSDGRAVVAADVALGRRDPWLVARVQAGALTDKTGRFRLAIPVARSNDAVEIRHTDYATLRRELSAVELESRSARFVLERGWLATGSVVDSEARGVAGARVELAEFGASERPFWQQDPVAGNAGTDVEGRFALPHVAPGKYTLRVEREGYAPALVPGIELPPGNGETEVGSVTLGPGVRVEGVVLTSERLPLQDVELQLGSGRQVPQQWATSDADGRFAFEDLAPGTELNLQAKREGWVDVTRTLATRADAAPLEIVMEPGLVVEGVVVDEAGAEIAEASVTVFDATGGTMMQRAGSRSRSALDGTFRMGGLPAGTYRLAANGAGFQPTMLEGIELRAGEERPALRVELRRGAVAFGRVLDHEGSPLSGVYVQFRDAASRNPFASPRELRPAPTDAEGRYRLEGLPLGKVTLTAEAQERRARVRDVTLEAGENEIDFVLEPALVLRGRVVDQQGAAVSGARVMVRSNGSRRGHQSDSEGRFETPAEPGTIVVLSASKAGAGASPEVDVEVRDVATPEVVLELRRGATVRGRVEGLDLDALSRTSVGAQPRSGQTDRGWFGMSGGTLPDFEGRFELADLQSGRWAIRATDRTTGRTVEEAIVIEPGITELSVTLRFEEGAILSGVVTLAGEPVVEARLQARGLDVAAESSARSDGQGSFRFEDLEHGTYQLVVDAPNRSLPHREQVEVDGDTEIAIDLPALQLAGRVVSKDTGAALSGAYVVLMLRERTSGETRPLRTQRDHRTDAEGAFLFTGLVPGLYVIEASQPDHASRVVEVRVDGEADEDVLVELEPEGGLVLRVLGPLGLAAPNVRIMLLQPDGTPSLFRSYAAGEDGRIAARDLPAGRHVLLVQNGDAMAELVVEVPGEERSVQLQRGGFIDVNAPELVDDRGRYPVELTRSAGATHGWTQNLPLLRNGFARIGPLPAGAWSIEVRAGSRSLVGTVLVEPGRTVAIELR